MNTARGLAFLLCAATGGAACARDAVPPAPAQVTREQLAALRWVEGRWRGIEAGGVPFHESYRLVNDSTLQSFTYADSTFRAITDSGTVFLRGDTLFSGAATGAAMQWVATSIDSTHVTFSPWHGATNTFTWRRAGSIVWLAELTWNETGAEGTGPRRRIYEMHLAP